MQALGAVHVARLAGLYMVLTVLFIVLPFELGRIVGPWETWKILVPVLAIGVGVLLWTGRIADRRGWTERFFFTGAALLEPTLASLLSRFARGPHRGTAFGVYSMAQFSGAFAGGLRGGAFLRTGRYALFLGLFVMTLLWALALTRIGRLRPRGSEGRAILGGHRPDPDRPAEPPERRDGRAESLREPDP